MRKSNPPCSSQRIFMFRGLISVLRFRRHSRGKIQIASLRQFGFKITKSQGFLQTDQHDYSTCWPGLPQRDPESCFYHSFCADALSKIAFFLSDMYTNASGHTKNPTEDLQSFTPDGSYESAYGIRSLLLLQNIVEMKLLKVDNR